MNRLDLYIKEHLIYSETNRNDQEESENNRGSIIYDNCKINIHCF